jgi:hypothetical protein
MHGSLIQDLDGLCNNLSFPYLSIVSTGKSLSEALIFASTNPQYDDRLFIELQVQYMKIPAQTWEEHVVYRNCSPHVLQKEELLTKIYLYEEKPYIMSDRGSRARPSIFQSLFSIISISIFFATRKTIIKANSSKRY